MTNTFGRSEEQRQAGGVYKTVSFLFISVLLLLFDARIAQTQLLRQGLEYLLIPSYLTLNFLVKQNEEIRSYFSLTKKQKEFIETLEVRNLYLERELTGVRILEKENEELRLLLDYRRSRQEERTLVAQVIGQKTTVPSQELIVDKGKQDGVQDQLPVMTRNGLVGQVITTNPYTARVLLITDLRHATPVMVERNSHRFILHGIGNPTRLLARDVDSNVDVKIGDRLITSGLGDVFPAGLLVAEVVKIDTERKHSFRQVWAESSIQAHITQFVLMANRNYD